MRALLASVFLSLALPAHADITLPAPISEEIGCNGLAATEARLSGLPAPTDQDRFALGGVLFLRAVEITFQDRYAYGMSDRTGLLPLLRLPLADNPNPKPFQPEVVVGIFTKAAAKLTEARTELVAIPGSSDFSVQIALKDLWFDVNANGLREPGEGVAEIIGQVMVGQNDQTRLWLQHLPTVRFDVADAAWLAAYADLLAGFSDMVRAYNPTEPISRALGARAAMAALGPLSPDPIFGNAYDPDPLDVIAILLATLNQPPKPDLMAEARTHFLAMIDENRQFWPRVASETDNDNEWLPSDSQTSALGIVVPPGTGAVWMGLLGDFEGLLNGTKLAPYWRVSGRVGINVAKLFSDPRPIDLAGWIQGWGVIPYLEKGDVVSWQTIDAFNRLTTGQAPLFAIYLN